MNFSPKRLIPLNISDMQPWNLAFWRKKTTKLVLRTSFCMKVTVKWMHVFVSFTHHRMNEWIWMNISLNFERFWGLQRAIAFFTEDTFQKFFLSQNDVQFKFQMLTFEPLGSLAKNLTCSSLLGLLTLQKFWNFYWYSSRPSRNLFGTI